MVKSASLQHPHSLPLAIILCFASHSHVVPDPRYHERSDLINCLLQSDTQMTMCVHFAR